jgi:hypothetical protein
VPTSPPLIKNITSPTSRSLRLTWTEIGSQSWHGVPSGYCVTYQSTSSNQSEIKVIPNVSQLSTMLTSVKPYTRYNVQVAAKTRAGCGVQDATSYVTLEDGKNRFCHFKSKVSLAFPFTAVNLFITIGIPFSPP